MRLVRQPTDGHPPAGRLAPTTPGRRIDAGATGALVCFAGLVAAIPAGFLLGRYAVFVAGTFIAVGVALWIVGDRRDVDP